MGSLAIMPRDDCDGDVEALWKHDAQKEKALTSQGFSLTGGANRSRTGLNGFAGRCITALLSRRKRCLVSARTVQKQSAGPPNKKGSLASPLIGAGDESRTRDLNLGKVALYQLSYSRIVLHFSACITRCARHRRLQNLERETSLELATSTLARLRSTN